MSVQPVAVVLLNWNGWVDTIECLETLLRSDYPDFRVIVCDNASTDGSLEHIQAWAEGRLEAGGAEGFQRLRATPLAKPVPYVRLNAEQALQPPAHDVPLTLIDTGGNFGFAGGNNVGLRHALASGRFAYYWLLNNDTVVEPDSLGQLVARMAADRQAGIGGSTLRHYYAAQVVQVAGGSATIHGAAVPRRWLPISRRPHRWMRLPLNNAWLCGWRLDDGQRCLLARCGADGRGLLSSTTKNLTGRAVRRPATGWSTRIAVYHKKAARSVPVRAASCRPLRCIICSTTGSSSRRFFPARLPLLYASMLLELGRAALAAISLKVNGRWWHWACLRAASTPASARPEPVFLVRIFRVTSSRRIHVVSFRGTSGLADYAVSLCRELSKLADTTLVTADSYDPARYHVDFPYAHLFRRTRQYPVDLLRYIVLRTRPDMVLWQSWLKFPMLAEGLVIMLFRLFGIRTALTVHDLLPHEPKPWSKAVCAWFYRRFDKLIAHSERTVQGLAAMHVQTTPLLVPHGIYDIFRLGELEP
jgi:hypothetical protein